ncbi:hypothetical protein NQ318_004378 [Aromia moschata]|uniref:Uncharacterized protein n=1 Tax=Aromia moschata TaxID=1265417 RepID=A0AAV8YQZ1_9CUCU|nr:hypothetical protein NQ318_004378 [Aromia moschata]
MDVTRAPRTEDLPIYCCNCKQTVLDPNAVNGELGPRAHSRGAVAASLGENRVTTGSVSEKLLRRRKVVPFYHELDDSLCSSLTEFTQNTEGSQCFEMPSDSDGSVGSDDDNPRPSKRRRIESEDENENENDSGEKPAMAAGAADD